MPNTNTYQPLCQTIDQNMLFCYISYVKQRETALFLFALLLYNLIITDN